MKNAGRQARRQRKHRTAERLSPGLRVGEACEHVGQPDIDSHQDDGDLDPVDRAEQHRTRSCGASRAVRGRLTRARSPSVRPSVRTAMRCSAKTTATRISVAECRPCDRHGELAPVHLVRARHQRLVQALGGGVRDLFDRRIARLPIALEHREQGLAFDHDRVAVHAFVGEAAGLRGRSQPREGQFPDALRRASRPLLRGEAEHRRAEDEDLAIRNGQRRRRRSRLLGMDRAHQEGKEHRHQRRRPRRPTHAPCRARRRRRREVEVSEQRLQQASTQWIDHARRSPGSPRTGADTRRRRSSDT